MTLTLVVVAKAPVPGAVKTRLTPPYAPTQAAALAAAALHDTLAAVRAAPATRRVLLLDGPAGDWVPGDVEVLPQTGGGLDQRLAAGLAAARGPTVVVAMDTPQVDPAWLQVPAGYDAVLGPAADGGYWALGLRRPDPALVRGVPMSTALTGTVQRARLVAAGLRVLDLPVLRDVDTAADARAVAASAPWTRFTRVLARCDAARREPVAVR